jgi:dCTP diphosphatase
MEKIDLKLIDEKVSSFIEERDWDQFHSIKNLSMALSVESAELVEIFQWMTELDSNGVKSNPELKQRVSEEIADIFVYLTRIAKKAEIDIQNCVLAKIEKNQEKYPVSKAKGSSKKYTEF